MAETNEWWTYPRWSDKFEQGTDSYIENAFLQGDQIACPCHVCHYRYWNRKNDVKDHIIFNGFVPRPGRTFRTRMDEDRQRGAVDNNDATKNTNDGVDELILDTLREAPTEDTIQFTKLLEEGQEELFPGCKTFTSLFFIIRAHVLKCDLKLSNVQFVGVLQLFKEVLPDAKIPMKYNDAKKVLKVLGLDYTKIDACPNDCMLYWEEHANATSCHVCGTPRWKLEHKEVGDTKKMSHKIPAKILRYFPIKKRLQRLYMCAEIAKYMTWHANEREKVNVLQHPANGQAWKDFDILYPKFSEESRNVRLALATDGFNPFHAMSIVHSTWPVILINYNLPPWMAMKSEFLMLSLLIPGPLSPGNDIDIYLQPLIKDLKDLWEFGIETYDASSQQVFNMHVALTSTVSDFPAYAMLSGWSAKGKFACPCCHYEADSVWLKNSKKHCYLGYRKFLDATHPWRHNRRKFNGMVEERSAPSRLTGSEVEDLLKDRVNEFGKKKRKRKQSADNPNPWKKFSIFFQLPYWKNCSNRHNLDCMHIEKNVFDSVIGTLLDISGKSKDHMAARRNLKELGIMLELQPKELEDGREVPPRSSFWMSSE